MRHPFFNGGLTEAPVKTLSALDPGAYIASRASHHDLIRYGVDTTQMLDPIGNAFAVRNASNTVILYWLIQRPWASRHAVPVTVSHRPSISARI